MRSIIPGLATGYWFGDPDSYSFYGMIAKISQRSNMSLQAASPTDQGTISAGDKQRERIYKYPTFSPHPDGTWVSQLINNHPNSFDDQLPYSQLTYDASGTLIQQIDTAWQRGDDGSPLVYSTRVTNQLKQTATTKYGYLPPNNQLVIVSQLDFDGTTVLRSVQTDYESSPEYAKRHIFNLPKVVQIFGPMGQVSYTEYAYDGQPLSDTPGVLGHSDDFDQYAPGHQQPGDWVLDCPYDGRGCKRIYKPGGFVSDYDPLTNFRGNITKATRYPETAPPRNPITETRLYDIDGNMVTMSTSCCEQTGVSYAKDTQYAYPSAVIRGSAQWSPGTHVSTSYTYYFNGLPNTRTDPNNRPTTWFYDDTTLRLRLVNLPTSASLSDSYDDVNQFTTETVRDAAGMVAIHDAISNGVLNRFDDIF
jgi:hypothetical protein